MKTTIQLLLCLLVGLGAGIGLNWLMRPRVDVGQELSLIRQEIKASKMRDAAASATPVPSDVGQTLSSIREELKALKMRDATDVGQEISQLRQELKAGKVQEAPDASRALVLVRDYLQAGKMQDAYDALLAAMRMNPADYAVFQACLQFVAKATKENSEEDMALATDIHERAATLIPFLPLILLSEARQAHTDAGEALFPVKKQAKAEDPFADSEMLLSAAKQSDTPSAARATLLHEVESELNSQVRRVASTPDQSQEDQASFWKRWKSVREDYDSAQKEVLAALYQDDCRPRLLDWRKRVADFKAHSADCPVDKIYAANTEIVDLVEDGTRISRDLAPYLEAAVTPAITDNGTEQERLDRQLMQLAQLREWNYNRWVLDRIAKVKESSGKPFDKIKSLVGIDETRLAPYTLQQFTAAWQDQFDKCEESDTVHEKVEATKLRILRGMGK